MVPISPNLLLLVFLPDLLSVLTFPSNLLSLGDVFVWPALTGDISFWSFVTFLVNNELNWPIEVTDILLSRMGYFSCICGIVNKVRQPSCWCCVSWAFCPGWVVSVSDSQLAFQILNSAMDLLASCQVGVFILLCSIWIICFKWFKWMPVNYFCQHVVLFALNTHNINMEYS